MAALIRAIVPLMINIALIMADIMVLPIPRVKIPNKI
jgi:hypothetical protein